jgi:PhzF family phenazine biosynthesis protein
MTMELTLYQLDAFASEVFTGNPAAVCPLEAWLPDEVMQAIAAENNLAETAFFLPEGEDFALRWFTPAVEVDLCGHATLASAFVIASHLDPGRDHMRFTSRSGPLEVTREGELYSLDFPAMRDAAVADVSALSDALGARPLEAWSAMDMMALFASEAEVARLAPDMAKLAKLDTRGVIVTAEGAAVDFVSRFFAPGSGIPEDPVTGSAHCMLTPFWAARLGRTRLSARQISPRGGDLALEDRGDRVIISGRVVPYMEGTIRVPG